MSEPVTAIPNLGPASAAQFAAVGITTAQELRAIGPDAAYLRLLQSGTAPHFIGYYALVMGLQGRPWNDCKGDEKVALRLRFDNIKAQAARAPTQSGLPREAELALNILGVRPR